MTKSTKQDFIPMHFIWVEKGIQDAISLRKSIKGANKKEKKRIAWNLALDNMFMLKRNSNACFSNLIYKKMLVDEEKFDIILREIAKTLIDSFMKEKSLKDAIKNDYLRAEILESNINFTEFMDKANKINTDTLRYLQSRWEDYMDQGDIEGTIGAEAYFREYQTNRIHYEILFSKNQIYEGVTFPQRYNYDAKSFSIAKIKNYRLYQPLSDKFPNFLGGIKAIFAKPIQIKLLNLMKSLFEIKEESTLEGEYKVFINRLLSIASLKFFKSLPIDEKIDLLNQKLSFTKLIDSLPEIDFNDFKTWLILVDTLNEYSFPQLAQKLVESFKSQIENLNISDKMLAYEVIAKIYKNQEKYQESQRYIEIALECFNNDRENKLKKNPLFELLIFSELAEVIGKSSDGKDLENILLKIQDLKELITDPREKHDADFRISKIFRFLEKYEEERSYLNELLDLNYVEIALEQTEYIKLRINSFFSTKMNSLKLSNIDKQEYLGKKIFEAVECTKHMYILEAIEKFHKILNFVEHNPEIIDRKEISIHLGHLFLHNQDYKNSSECFSRILLESPDFESELYSSISNWMINEKQGAKKNLDSLPAMLMKASDKTHEIFDYWILTLVNILSVDKLVEFFQFIFDNDSPEIHVLWIKIGLKLADFGFFQHAQQFVNLGLEHSELDKQKARCYNILGTIFANKDAHRQAITQYREALLLDQKYILCYQNLGRSFMHLHDYQNAIRNFKKALEISSKTGYPALEIISIKSDLFYCESYKVNYFNIESISSEKIRNALVSADRIYLHFYTKKNLLDASSIINSYSKALELILHEEISPIFKTLIEKYQEQYFKNKLSRDFHMKFGNLFRDKTINLGTWSRIMQDFQKTQKEISLEEFRTCITTNINEDLLLAVKSACDFITPLRNPLTHQENITLDEVVERRLEIIKLLNDLIDKIYKTK